MLSRPIGVTMLCVVLALGLRGPAMAQTASSAAGSADLQRQIQTLSERLRTLEALFAQTPQGRSLLVSNRAGKDVLEAGIDTDNTGLLRLSDEAGTTAVTASAGKDGGLLWLHDRNGKNTVQAAASESGGSLLITDRDGNTQAFAGTIDAGGAVSVYNRQDNIVGILRATKEGGLLRLNDPAGKSAVELGIDPKSNRIYANIGHINMANDEDGGLLTIDTNGGKRVVELGVASSGDAHFTLNGRNARDYAEVFELKTRDGVVPGTVMVAAADGSGALEPSSQARDARVVGVVGGAGTLRHAVLVGTRADGSRDHAIALAGQVFVRATDSNGAIVPGDLLVSGAVAGTAMRAGDGVTADGRVLGKALGRLDGGEGLVLMLVMPR